MFSQLHHRLYSVEDAIHRLATPTWRISDFGLQLTADRADFAGHETIRQRLFPLLRRNLHRITALSLSLPEPVSFDVYAALNVPAPLLERFEPEMPDGWTGELDERLFAGNTGVVTSVYLSNVAVPERRVPAFANVRFLCFNFDGVLRNAERFFPQFPSLQELQFNVGAIKSNVWPFTLPTMPGDPDRSTLLEVQARMSGRSEFFMHFPLNNRSSMNIPDMQWDIDDKWSGELPWADSFTVFICIPAPLYVCLQGVRILYRSGANNATRRIDVLSREMLAPDIMGATLGDSTVANKIVVLGVSTKQWSELVQKIADVPALEVLSLRYGEAEHDEQESWAFPLKLPQKPFQCPRLRMLVLEDELETGNVHTATLAEFVDLSLNFGDASPRALDLMLKQVVIRGDLSILGQRFLRVFACESDDTSGWLRGLVEEDGFMCHPSDYGRRHAGEEARGVALIARVGAGGTIEPRGEAWQEWNVGVEHSENLRSGIFPPAAWSEAAGSEPSQSGELISEAGTTITGDSQAMELS
ncbi:hypothetical protein AURDEDRAFT_125269 [Auricularia subglabra TFB-10046 SS5]|nr:hypothetical protein AURDEDRAFT_125269 [Auricularia subglabra TFB-10046 SS5]